MASQISKKSRAVYAFIAVLWVAFAAGQTLHSGLRLTAPQKTSRAYQDLLSFTLGIGLTDDQKTYVDAMLLRELEIERSRGRHGLITWACLLVAGALTLGL